MATKPATAPEAMPSTLGFPLTVHSMNIQARAAAAVAICVTAIAIPARPSAATAEPALKPNPPTHRSESPISVSTRVRGAMESLLNPTRFHRRRVFRGRHRGNVLDVDHPVHE